ncbi:MAG: hypothetical protein CBC38_03060 [Gammaproteobacteria bacterium TMED78]|nr:MAG: hypothetical protein CBC38_03060 [Gammaproteobacteria bacterium TMED78]|tara:strand:+ start:20323 stop:21975 length:1653 start_codon:yes stop_codon:yes gene_type:complete
MNEYLSSINNVLWHDATLYILILTGIIFTIWTKFCQFKILSHGVKALKGDFDDESDPGTINHFQALSAALSATVGLGNIGGVAIAISLGGPGAIFWMWVVGFLGMSIKLTEVSLSMIYRNIDSQKNTYGGPMWVAKKGLKELNPKFSLVGKMIGSIFCVTMLISTITGGNMFQAWNVGEITQEYFGISSKISGIVLSLLVGLVIIGGIKRIGLVASKLVPLMVTIYLIAGSYVLIMNLDSIPHMFYLIFISAFSPHEFNGAFIGGTAGYAFLIGMKRALFSNEAGQGTSPIVHSAAKTREPVREGMVAGLEPFIDTIVICTFTALVILSSNIWNRAPEGMLLYFPEITSINTNEWRLEDSTLSERTNGQWQNGENIFIIVKASYNSQTGNNLHKINGEISKSDNSEFIIWENFKNSARPSFDKNEIYVSYVGATLTAKAFDSVMPGLGKWLITISVWLFALSTMISWSYYGEQSVIYLFGKKMMFSYKLIFCILIVVATWGFIETDSELDNLTGFGTGVTLLANLPIIYIFSKKVMRSYHEYLAKLDNKQ